MRPAAFFTGIGGMVVVVGLLMAGQAQLGGASDGDDVAPSDTMPETTSEIPPAAEPRPVMPDTKAEALAEAAAQTPPATAPSAMTSTATPTTPAKPAAPAAAKPDERKSVELARPSVESAGLLSFGDRQLQLAEIVPTPGDKTCGSSGKQWPCGTIAKTQLRQFLRGRTISCDIDTAEWKGTMTAACRLGNQDISAWLTESGWAEAAAGSPLAADNAKAKAEKLGLYGDDPRKKALPPLRDSSPAQIAPDARSDPL